STEDAYRVPWVFERSDGHFTLRNLGSECLTAVTLNLYGSGVMPASAPVTLETGESLEIVISGDSPVSSVTGAEAGMTPEPYRLSVTAVRHSDPRLRSVKCPSLRSNTHGTR